MLYAVSLRYKSLYQSWQSTGHEVFFLSFLESGFEFGKNDYFWKDWKEPRAFPEEAEEEAEEAD